MFMFVFDQKIIKQKKKKPFSFHQSFSKPIFSLFPNNRWHYLQTNCFFIQFGSHLQFFIFFQFFSKSQITNHTYESPELMTEYIAVGGLVVLFPIHKTKMEKCVVIFVLRIFVCLFRAERVWKTNFDILEKSYLLNHLKIVNFEIWYWQMICRASVWKMHFFFEILQSEWKNQWHLSIKIITFEWRNNNVFNSILKIARFHLGFDIACPEKEIPNIWKKVRKKKKRWNWNSKKKPKSKFETNLITFPLKFTNSKLPERFL